MSVGLNISDFAEPSATDRGPLGVYLAVPVARPIRTFGRVLKDIRTAKGKAWSQKYVAKLASLNHFSVSKCENDAPKITIDTYAKVCRVLGTTIEAVAADMDPSAELPVSIREFLGQGPVGNPSVRIPNRTRYDADEPLAHEGKRLSTTASGGEESGMPSDPYFTSIKNFWPDFDDAQRAEALSAIAKIHGHRKRAVGESPGKI